MTQGPPLLCHGGALAHILHSMCVGDASDAVPSVSSELSSETSALLWDLYQLPAIASDPLLPTPRVNGAYRGN